MKEYSLSVELIQIYECLCDVTRLRLLNLLAEGPLCVCHFQEVLGEPQVKISKHLGYLRTRGLVTARREGNWVIYALPDVANRSAELDANLACLQDCARENTVLKRDTFKLGKLDRSCAPTAVAVGEGKRGTACGYRPAGLRKNL